MKDRTIAEQLEELKAKGELKYDDLPESNVAEEKSQDVETRIANISFDSIDEDVDFFIQKSDEHINGYKVTDDLKEQSIQETLQNPDLTEDEKREEIQRILNEYKPTVDKKYGIPFENAEDAIVKFNRILDKKFKELKQKQNSYGLEFEKGEERIYDNQRDKYVETMLENNPEVKEAREKYNNSKALLEDLENKLEGVEDPQEKQDIQNQIEEAKGNMEEQEKIISDKSSYYTNRLATIDKMAQDIGKEIEEYNQKLKKVNEFKKYYKINIKSKYNLELKADKLYNYSKIHDYESKAVDEQIRDDENESIVNQDENSKDKDNYKSYDNEKNMQGSNAVNNVSQSNNSQQNVAPKQEEKALSDPKKESKIRKLLQKIKAKFVDFRNGRKEKKQMQQIIEQNAIDDSILNDKRNLSDELERFVLNDREYANNMIKNMKEEEFKGFNLDDKLIKDFKEHSEYIKRYENMSRTEILKERVQKKIDNITSKKENPEPGIEI